MYNSYKVVTDDKHPKYSDTKKRDDRGFLVANTVRAIPWRGGGADARGDGDQMSQTQKERSSLSHPHGERENQNKLACPIRTMQLKSWMFIVLPSYFFVLKKISCLFSSSHVLDVSCDGFMHLFFPPAPVTRVNKTKTTYLHLP